MSTFKFQKSVDAEGLAIALEGSIDEDVQFPPVEASKFKTVRIDLGGVKTINSVGIREWLNWIRPIGEQARVVLRRCPKALVFQLNMVEGFLPKGGFVESFEVPFFCEKCDTEKNALFTVGKEVVAGPSGPKVNFDLKAAKLCAETPCGLEIDASEAKYFQFLKKLS
jgi:ABC-type transporter Mla MlaB component